MVELRPLTRFNWEEIAALKTAPDQQDFLPSNLFSIAQSRFEPSELFGVYVRNEAVGFVMLCKWAEVYWITRIMIAESQQSKGYGKTALEKTLQYLKNKTGLREVRTSILNKNAFAEYLFTSCGFERSERLDDKEFVMKLQW